MLREEVQEVENAIDKDILHEVLAESMDVLYLTFNLLQECGLERAIEPAFLMKHEDNMKKQHETVAHLAWTRNAYTQSTLARQTPKWPLPYLGRKKVDGFFTLRVS